MKLILFTCKSMVFNFSKKFQFLPDLYLEGTHLSLAQETKLLGVTITNDCKWDANTKAIVYKANKRLWFLRRLRVLGANKSTLLDICWSVLEYCSPVWCGALTKKNKNQIDWKGTKNRLQNYLWQHFQLTWIPTWSYWWNLTANKRRETIIEICLKMC